MENEIRVASIVIWEGKAYVPSNARYDNNGPFTDIEPVHVVNPELDELLAVLQETLSKKPLILPEPTHDDAKARRDLMLRVTGARNWKQLSQKGVLYIIEQSPKGFLLEMSRLDSKGRWEFNPDKRITFPPGTDLSVVIQAVLGDLKTRPK